MKQQQGVALLTILIMVVLATILAGSLLRQQQNQREQTAMLLRQDQAYLYAQSAEYFLAALLAQDGKDNAVDNPAEMWAKPMPAFPVEDGVVTGELSAEEGKFNLNQLLNKDGSINPAAKRLFQNMLKRLNLDENLVDAVIDWQDADQDTVSATGAENSYYQGLREGYLAPNQRFTSVEQLQQVRGFAGTPYQLLKPYITVLPTSQSKININLASPFLLSCLDEQLALLPVQNALKQRQQEMQYFDKVDELWQIAPFSAVDAGQRGQWQSLLDVQSHFFLAKIEVNLSGRHRYLSSWLYRDKDTVQTYQRSWAALQLGQTRPLPAGLDTRQF